MRMLAGVCEWLQRVRMCYENMRLCTVCSSNECVSGVSVWSKIRLASLSDFANQNYSNVAQMATIKSNDSGTCFVQNQIARAHNDPITVYLRWNMEMLVNFHFLYDILMTMCRKLKYQFRIQKKWNQLKSTNTKDKKLCRQTYARFGVSKFLVYLDPGSKFLACMTTSLFY